MNCQFCGKPTAGARGQQEYQGMSQEFCTCYIPKRGYMESNSSHRHTISLAAITYELAEQRKLLEEILAMVKVKNNS